MISQNIFSADSFKKQILSSEGITPIDSSDPLQEVKDIISAAPKIPNQRGIKNIIADASILSKVDSRAKADEINSSLNAIMTKYNEDYGLDIHVDFSNMSRTLVEIADPKKRRGLELYLSQIFSSTRVVIILNLISKLGLIIDYVLDPERLFGPNSTMSHQDLFLVIEKLLFFCDQLETMKNEVMIKGDDLELQKLSQESGGSEDLSSGASENFKKFMEMFESEQLGKDV